ncbi:MAG: hypothetical protein ABIS92_03105 [Polyangia bacterium]
MSSNRRPQKWLCCAAFAAAFWITLRVVAAPVPPAPLMTSSSSDTSLVTDQPVPSAEDAELRDPALERLISGLVQTARRGRR